MKYRGITIHKRSDAQTWYTRHRVNGKVVYISAKTQQECYNKLKELIKQEERGEKSVFKILKRKESESVSITFLEWYNKWLEFYKKDRKETTKDSYKNSLKYLIKISNKPMNQITSLDILEELNKIEHERQKQKVYEFLKDIFAKAKLNKIIQENPLEIIDKPKHKRQNGNALTNEDEEKIIEIFKAQNLDMFLVCLYQGLRRGEMLALTRDDIDFEHKTLRINKSINDKNEVDTTKNTYSNRVMPLFDNSIAILKNYKNTHGRLFDISKNACEDKFRTAIKDKFNVRYTIHSLRHTFITKCQEAGVPLHIIQKWVGHNIGSEVTSKVYTHSRELAELENIEKINDLLLI